MKSFIQRGGLWVAAQGVILVAATVHPFAAGGPTWSDGLSSLRLSIAVVIALLGFSVAALAAMRLGKALTPLPSPDSKGQLITDGLFALVRHPIYLGVILFVFGCELLSSRMVTLVWPALLVLFFDRKSAFEETLLEARYPDYAEYRTRTKKLIPWLY